jgi:hypothetical protein
MVPDGPTSVATTSVMSTTPLQLSPFFFMPSGKPPDLETLSSSSSPANARPVFSLPPGRFRMTSLSSNNKSVQGRLPGLVAAEVAEGNDSVTRSSTSIQSINRRLFE